MPEPSDQVPAATGHGRLRTSHADREHAIEMLKAAYVQGMLTKDELDARVGQALTSRTYADLAALTTDIPPAPAAASQADPGPPPTAGQGGCRVGRLPGRVAAGSGGCLVIAFAAMQVHRLADPGNAPGTLPASLALPSFLVALTAVFAALFIVIAGAATAVEQRRSLRQLPPRQGPGGHGLGGGQRGGAGPGPVPTGPRTDLTSADLRAHKSRQHRQHVPVRAGRHHAAPDAI
jgi:hypothetical protein